MSIVETHKKRDTLKSIELKSSREEKIHIHSKSIVATLLIWFNMGISEVRLITYCTANLEKVTPYDGI